MGQEDNKDEPIDLTDQDKEKEKKKSPWIKKGPGIGVETSN